MDFCIRREYLLAGMQRTAGIVEKKTTMPILNNVLITAQTGKVTISATDLEIAMMVGYEADVRVEGTITLSARKLHELVRETQGEMVHFVKNEKDLVTITCDKAVYRIPGLGAGEYPNIAEEEGIRYFAVSSEDILELIRKTYFAISTDPLRKNLTGVLFESQKKESGAEIRMVATDGHRMAMAWKTLGPDVEFLEMEKGVILPRKGLGEIRKLLDDSNGEVRMGIHQGMCIFKTDNAMLKVRLIDSEYPDYRRVIPVEKGYFVRFERDRVLHALRRMSVISSEGYSGVIVKMTADKMVLHSTNPDVGEASEEVEVSYQDPGVEVAYNVNFLIDAIEVIGEGDGMFEIGGAKKPGIVRPVDSERYLCIIMPLKF
ncbi:MAG TPA: DNA polymerase III subunit beta [Syntrophales bacterium]|jgi:DNA polymerase-3 subunit beta|nr:DNA polymerase III subunit beta [Syntrophales bacterium]